MDRSTRRVRSCLIFVAILVVALAGIAARPPGFLSTFWPANAILLGILLRNPRSFAPIGLAVGGAALLTADRSDEHTSELQSLMRISYAVFCLKKKINNS